jgi:hypothetical protein
MSLYIVYFESSISKKIQKIAALYPSVGRDLTCLTILWVSKPQSSSTAHYECMTESLDSVLYIYVFTQPNEASISLYLRMYVTAGTL